MTYDAQCYDLAVHFLWDEPHCKDFDKRYDMLAQHIQRAIEDWIEGNPPGPAHRGGAANG